VVDKLIPVPAVFVAGAGIPLRVTGSYRFKLFHPFSLQSPVIETAPNPPGVRSTDAYAVFLLTGFRGGEANGGTPNSTFSTSEVAQLTEPGHSLRGDGWQRR
jgi:hypothetical protein